MTLLITTFAAIVTSIIWYGKILDNKMKLGTLALIYWGAALMWFVDAIFEYTEVGADYFNPAPINMLNDAFLGVSAVVAGLIIWLIYIIISDPKGTLKNALIKKEEK